MSCPVADFIKRIRNCKTKAQQRQEVQKQMAAIRQSFRKSDKYKARSLAKLIFINMMGQDTDFGQMVCFDLMSSDSFVEKRIGYLGLTQLFHQKSDLLISSTNKIRDDLKKMHRYDTALALGVLGEVCSSQMAKTLAPQVFRIATDQDALLTKKALLVSSRMIRKCPQLIPDILGKIDNILYPSNDPGILLGAIGLLDSIIETDQNYIGKTLSLIPLLGNISKFQIEKRKQINHFIMVGILKLFRFFAKVSNKSQIQSIKQKIINIVQYVQKSDHKPTQQINLQTIRTILSMDPIPQGLGAKAHKLSLRFLQGRDANTKFLALQMIQGMIKIRQPGQLIRHKNLIDQCFKQNDIIIKRKALKIYTLIAVKNTAQQIIASLLKILLSQKDQQFIVQLANSMCYIISNNAVSRRWQLDNLLNVMQLAKQDTRNSSIQNLIHVIQATPQLRECALYNTFIACSQTQNNSALQFLCIYLLGQFGQCLFKRSNINQQQILNLIQNIILRVGAIQDVKMAGLSALLKLYYRFYNKNRIKNIIQHFQNSPSYQIQKRSCQYQRIIQGTFAAEINSILKPVGPPKNFIQTLTHLEVGSIQFQLSRGPLADIALLSKHQLSPKQRKKNKQLSYQLKNINLNKPDDSPTRPPPKKNLLDDDPYDILGGGGAQAQPQLIPPNTLNPKKQTKIDLFQGLDQPTHIQTSKTQVTNIIDPFTDQKKKIDIMSKPTQPKKDSLDFMQLLKGAEHQVKTNRFMAWRNDHLMINFQTKVNGNKMQIKVAIKNTSNAWIQNCNIKVASLQHINISNISSLDNPNLMSEQQSNLNITLQNNNMMIKEVALMIQPSYLINGQIFQTSQRVNFPHGF